VKVIIGRGIILLIILLLQVTILPKILGAGLKPDLFLIFTACIALLHGSRQGLGAGFFSGFLQDLYGSGSNIFIKPFLSYFCGKLEGKLYKENYFFPPLIVFGLSLLHGILTFIVHEEYLFNLSFGYAFSNLIFPIAVINAITTFFVYPLIFWLERKWKD